jgi:hypothetical protein
MSRRLLHVIVQPGQELAREIIREQQTSPGLVVKVCDLTVAEPDYVRLLEDIFAADSISVW